MDSTQTTLPTKYLLAIDPGLATGVAFIDITDISNPVAVWSAEVDIRQFHDQIKNLIEMEGVEIVVEDFRITTATGKLSEAPWSLKLIGVVEYLAYLNNKRVWLQKPSQKPFATNDRLRSVGFWHVGGEGHANDAFRHAMVWIVEHNREWTKKLLT